MPIHLWDRRDPLDFLDGVLVGCSVSAFDSWVMFVSETWSERFDFRLLL